MNIVHCYDIVLIFSVRYNKAYGLQCSKNVRTYIFLTLIKFVFQYYFNVTQEILKNITTQYVYCGSVNYFYVICLIIMGLL